jgi:CheY-like chemotaxis protein
MNILIVDDETEYRVLLGKYLEGEGHTVFLADNGDDGLEKINDAAMDIIITDVYMPVIDGLKFHKIVRANPKHAHIPFLFVSGYDDEYTLETVRASNLDGFVRKARPLNEMKAWLQYLTLPLNKRPPSPPSGVSKRPTPDRPCRSTKK